MNGGLLRLKLTCGASAPMTKGGVAAGHPLAIDDIRRSVFQPQMVRD